MQKRIVAVIPLYNKAATINRALASIMAQARRPDAVVVVDDGSTDDSVARIEPHYRAQIELLSIPNGGPGGARNRGARHVKADLIAFLDADDEWYPDHLDSAARALAAEPACGAYVAAYDVGADKAAKREEVRALFPRSGVWSIAAFHDPRALKAYIDSIHSSSTVVRRDVFERLGGFFDRERCTYGEDAWLWLQLAFTMPIFVDRDYRTRFHVEDSALGHALAGRHPRHPALRFAEELRTRIPAERRALLDRLLAYYRLIETEKLAARGDCAEVPALRRAFRFGGRIPLRLIARDAKVHVTCLRRRRAPTKA
uniref:glycosyltransferase family 2 protein n=1 Tax=uncultured Sphingomonas sp. TaxID=158754 RepID=UPI0025881923|nr:glycosyltransferase family A protein [uncultured Sphingomonas sp.]